MRPILSLVASLLLVAGCGGGHPAATQAPPLPAAVPVQVAVASIAPTGGVEWLSGTVRAAGAATVMARLPGTVARLPVAPGSSVAADQVLAVIDAREVLVRREQAQAAVAAAKATVAQAQAGRAEAQAMAVLAASELARMRQLVAQQAATRADLDAAVARDQAAQARTAAAGAQVEAAGRGVAAAEAAAAEAEVMAGYLTLRAPFAGVVVRTQVEVGDLLAPGRAVLDLEDPTRLRLEADVPESLVGMVALGSSLRVQVPAAGIDLAAPVVEVVPAADPASRTVRVKLALPPGAALRSGQFGRVGLPRPGDGALGVPAGAVVHRGQLDAVMVVEEGAARLRLVRLGAVEDGRAVVRAGLSPGETVVAADAAALADGQPVIVR